MTNWVLSKLTCSTSSGENAGEFSAFCATITPSSDTARAVPTAMPIEPEMLWVSPRKAPTSPASSFGFDIRSLLNTSATMHPCASPSVTSPTTTDTWLQSLRIVNARRVSARNTTTKATRVMLAGLTRW